MGVMKLDEVRIRTIVRDVKSLRLALASTRLPTTYDFFATLEGIERNVKEVGRAFEESSVEDRALEAYCKIVAVLDDAWGPNCPVDINVTEESDYALVARYLLDRVLFHDKYCIRKEDFSDEGDYRQPLERLLTRFIDTDEPPGLAAVTLARQILDWIEESEGKPLHLATSLRLLRTYQSSRHRLDMKEQPHPLTSPPPEILRWFDFKHLPERLQAVSESFSEFARAIAALAPSEEREVALRKLLECKDAAVRATIASDNSPVSDGADKENTDPETARA